MSEIAASSKAPYWTNQSVAMLARGRDPITVVTERAREMVFRAVEEGWEGPPFNPFDLADRLGIEVVPRDEIADAQAVPVGTRGMRIEFNPNRPKGRVRFSVAHELGHMLFPDCAETIRRREKSSLQSPDDGWQLELLCNVAAAEMLMPIGSFEELRTEQLTVGNLMSLRRRFDVSTEAMFIRSARLAGEPCAVVASSRDPQHENSPMYRVDYSIPSRTWRTPISPGLVIGSSGAMRGCTAVGFTSCGRERWTKELPELDIECVGIPPYPGSRYPRVLALVRATGGAGRRDTPAISTTYGDATTPHGEGTRLIAQIVNDKSPTWGAGFALAVRKRWPEVQAEFQGWVRDHSEEFALGTVHRVSVAADLAIVHMIAQHGYGPSKRARIRYAALRECLHKLATIAIEMKASVHMPRIGTGQAGGNWNIVQELIEETLVKRGVPVTVYVPPEEFETPPPLQTVLPLSA